MCFRDLQRHIILPWTTNSCRLVRSGKQWANVIVLVTGLRLRGRETRAWFVLLLTVFDDVT